MYLEGRKHLFNSTITEDNLPVKQIVIDLGYWRKHPNLHGYIVKNFANGVDECQTIELRKDDIIKIIQAIKLNELPHTTGFFFGTSDKSHETVINDLHIFNLALGWLQGGEPKNEYRYVTYLASW